MNLFVSRSELRHVLALPSAQVLILANLGLIAAVIAWDWSVVEIVFLYWVENLVVGVINVFRMALATGEESQRAPLSKRVRQWEAMQQASMGAQSAILRHGFKFFLIPFFIVHYGGFCYGHGVFVLAMFGDGGWLGSGSGAQAASFAELFTPNLRLAVAVLAASHLFSFFRNFLAGGEYRRTNAAALMMRPYGRIVALHLTILLGAALTAIFGSPVGMLVVLVALKTAADLAMHGAERQKLGTVPA